MGHHQKRIARRWISTWRVLEPALTFFRGSDFEQRERNANIFNDALLSGDYIAIVELVLREIYLRASVPFLNLMDRSFDLGPVHVSSYLILMHYFQDERIVQVFDEVEFVERFDWCQNKFKL
jgi:hypothetical protein